MGDLAELVESGVDLDGALQILSARGGRAAGLARILHGALSRGAPVSDSFAQIDCPDIVLGVLRVGELTGDLRRAMQGARDYLTKRRLRTERLHRTLAYPLLLAVLSTVVVYILDLVVLPDFRSMYRALGVAVSASAWWWTRAGVRVSEVAPVVALVSAAGIRLGMRYAGRSTRRFAVRFLLNRRIVRTRMQYYIARPAWEMLALTLGAGMDLLSALRALERADELGLGDLWAEVIGQVEQGLTLSAALRQRPEMPEAVLDLLHVAEHTGDLALGADRIYRHLDGVVERAVDRVLAGVEPAATLLLGGMVGGATMLFFYPMLELIRQMA